MTAYKRTQITVETDQITIIRRRGCTRHWCGECGRETDMVSLSQAGVLRSVPQPLLLNGARTEKWHVTKAADGSPLICLDSLLNAAEALTD
jgi:hypothetical protein